MRSLRFDSVTLGCHIELPTTPPRSPLTCINANEAKQASFVSLVTRESKAQGTLVVSISEGRVATRMHTSGSQSFRHQLVSALSGGETAARAVERSIALLLGRTPPITAEVPFVPPASPQGPWYTKWWVWALAGTAVAAIIATTVMATRENNVQVVFGH
jgi:hypothetical protein